MRVTVEMAQVLPALRASSLWSSTTPYPPFACARACIDVAPWREQQCETEIHLEATWQTTQDKEGTKRRQRRERKKKKKKKKRRRRRRRRRSKISQHTRLKRAPGAERRLRMFARRCLLLGMSSVASMRCRSECGNAASMSASLLSLSNLLFSSRCSGAGGKRSACGTKSHHEGWY